MENEPGSYMHLSTYRFPKTTCHLPSSWFVGQAISLSRHLAEQEFDTRYKATTIGKALCMGLPQWETHDIPTPPKITFNAIKHVFLAKEWNSFHLTGEKFDYLHFKKNSTMNVNCT